MMSERQRAACAAVDAMLPQLAALSDWMYRNPEIGFAEVGAAEHLTDFLASEGFAIDRGVGGMPTAFIGTHCGASPGPSIGVFAEYDALPDIGHACGHNIIGACAVGAAAAVKRAWPDLPGTIQLFGSPAEEGGGGKVIMVEQGLVQSLDAAMMIHASVADRTMTNNLSVQRMDLTFHGRTAQPAGSAHEGVSAFEAAILTWTNINAIRQYLEPDFYVHGIMKEGGFAANVIPDRASLVMYARAPRGNDLEYLIERITNCAKAAALTTGATMTITEVGKRFLRVVNNPTLSGLLAANYARVGRPAGSPTPRPRASTDMGNVSQVVPSIHGYIRIGDAAMIGNTHSPEFAPHTVTDEAHKAIADAAKAMAMTCVDLFEKPALLDQAQREFAGLMSVERA